MTTIRTHRAARALVPTALAACLVAVLIAYSGAADASGLVDDPDAIVIVFEETTVTRAEFDAAFDVAARSTAIGQGLPVTDEVLAEFEPFRVGFLEQYGTQLVLAAEAAERGVGVSDDQVEQVVGQLRQEQADEAAFQAWLDAAGYGDEAALRDALHINLSAQALVDRLAAGIEVDPQVVRSWYDANPEAVTLEDGELMPFEAVEAQIAQLLQQEALDAEVREIARAAGLTLYPEGR